MITEAMKDLKRRVRDSLEQPHVEPATARMRLSFLLTEEMMRLT